MQPSSELLLRDVMNSRVFAISPHQTLEFSSGIMVREQASCVVVVQDRQPVGVLTEHDVVRLCHERVSLPDVAVASVMSQPVVMARPDLDIHAAYELLQRHQCRHLVVTEENTGQIVGVANLGDFCGYLESTGAGSGARTAHLSKGLREKHARLESRLEMVLDKTGIGIWEFDHLLNHTVWSDSLCKLLGCEQVPETLTDWLARIHPDDRAHVEAAVIAALGEGNPLYEVEYRLRSAEGQWLWFYARGKVVERDAEGRALRTVGTMTDISQRKYAELLLRIQHSFSEKLAELPSRELLQEAILNAALTLPELDGGGLYWIEPDRSYRLIIHRGFSDEFIAQVHHLPMDSRRAGLIRSGRLLTSCCPACDHCDEPSLGIGPELAAEGILALVVMPITVGGNPVACLNLASKHTAQIGPSAITALDTLTGQFSQALERLLAREEAAIHEKDLQNLFGAIQDYLVVVDEEGRILHYNKAVAEELGYGGTLLGQSVLRLHPPESHQEGKEIVGEILAGRRSSCPLPLLKADGTRIFVDTRVMHGHWGGKPVIIGISRDMTELIGQQEALRVEKRFTDDIINALPGIFYIFDENGRFLRWNKHFLTTSGYPEERLAAMSTTDFFEGEDKSRIAQAVKAVFEHGEATIEVELRTQSGRRIPYYFTGARTVIDGKPYLAGMGIDITEEREAKRALLSERAFLKTLVRTIPDLIWLKDPEGVYLACNPMFERFFGAREEEIVGKSDYDFLPPGEVEFFRAHDRAAMAAGKPTVNEEWITFADDGHRALLETIKTPMCWPNGEIIGVLGVARDITAMREAQEALREREDIFSAIVNQALDGIVLIDVESRRFVEFNDAACEALGYTREEFSQLSLYDIQVDITREDVDRRLIVFSDDQQRSFEIRHRRKSGEVVHVRASNRLIKLHGGSYIAAIWVDISDEIRNREALNEANLFMRETQAIAHVGGWKANPVSDTLMWTEEVYRLVEHPLDRPPASLAEGLRYYSPEYLPKVKAELVTAWENSTPFAMECEMISASGRHFWAELRCVGKIDQRGGTFLTGTFQDITARRRIEDEIRRINQSLEQRVIEEVAKNRDKDLLLIQQSRLAALGEMMHNVAHQWRQPLNTLNLILQNIKDAYDFGDLTAAYLEQMTEKGNRIAQKMSQTIDDFRNFFQPDSVPSRFSLSDMVAEALLILDASLANHHIEVHVEKAREITVTGYSREYSHVLLNILSNAKDAIKEHAGSGRIDVWIGEANDMATVRIRDSGGGIPEPVIEKVFDPYFTTKESGTGIGLYMSRMIMKHMQGDIAVHNVEGGAEVVVSLPLAETFLIPADL